MNDSPQTRPGVLDLAPSNEQQAAAWSGDVGSYWTANADRYDDGVAAYQKHLLAAAAIRPDDHVLDIGCGAGRTTRDAAREACEGQVLGLDLSPQLLDLARARALAEGFTNVTFRHADAQVVALPVATFDVAVSRHGAMFFADPVAAFANIGRSLTTNGRLALLTWQPYSQQDWLHSFRTILAAGRALPDPEPNAPNAFGLSDPARVDDLLTRAGYDDVRVVPVAEAMYFGPDPDDAARFIRGQFAELLRDVSLDVQDQAMSDLRADMARHQNSAGVHYPSAGWLIQARWNSGT